MQRGDVWWATLASPLGRRPVLLVSRNAVYQLRASVTIATITRTVRGISTEVVLDEGDGMPTRCVVNLDNIFTVSKQVLAEYITTLSPAKIAQVDRAMVFALGLGENV